MPVIEPQDTSLKDLHGMHLWHAPMSSCSQRVRLILAEVDKDYESHLIDIEKNEHSGEAYQAIHPKGVVPALVDDGTLIIESIDIIKHIARVTGFSLGTDPNGLMELADRAQVDLKLLTYEFLFRAKPRPDSVNEEFQRTHKNAWLKDFRRDFAKGFPKDRVDGAVNRTLEGFQTLNTLLRDGRKFLTGDQFALADIAWIPNVQRMSLMGWPFETTPHLQIWFQHVSRRKSYSVALEQWQNENANAHFKAFTEKGRANNTGVHTFGNLASNCDYLRS